ncbi:DUF1833 family protein [Bradyrhizobium sp. SZCCHNS3002]|uniref:DUF1833 family protein n=1 Tax=Bradyrhizobium sp. SZCCHNS3002 TaxID=3057310 RepID=UPI0028F096C5|nr:DUF1833 family protein [Bradyrhizobium sp. SZCCHNS3002]
MIETRAPTAISSHLRSVGRGRRVAPTEGPSPSARRHPSFAQAARVVANVGDDMSYGIKAGAPRDARSTVTFVACPFQADHPAQREAQPPSCRISIDNIARELVPQIRAALGVRAYIDVLYREYLGSDLTRPARGRVHFELRNVPITGTTLTAWSWISKDYTYQQFPSLLP